jgi:hypothetical protein
MNNSCESLQALVKNKKITDYNIQTAEIYAEGVVGIKVVLTVFKDKTPSVSTGYHAGTAYNMEETLEQALQKALKKSSINNFI